MISIASVIATGVTYDFIKTLSKLSIVKIKELKGVINSFDDFSDGKNFQEILILLDFYISKNEFEIKLEEIETNIKITKEHMDTCKILKDLTREVGLLKKIPEWSEPEIEIFDNTEETVIKILKKNSPKMYKKAIDFLGLSKDKKGNDFESFKKEFNEWIENQIVEAITKHKTHTSQISDYTENIKALNDEIDNIDIDKFDRYLDYESEWISLNEQKNRVITNIERLSIDINEKTNKIEEKIKRDELKAKINILEETKEELSKILEKRIENEITRLD